MTDDPTGEGQAPEPTSPAEPGQAPGPANAAPDPAPAQDADAWDPERARATIEAQRKAEAAAKKLAAQHEKEAKELRQRLEALEAERMTEEEKREKAHQDALAKAAELERREAELAAQLANERLQNAVERAAGREVRDKNGTLKRAAFHAPDEAYALLNKAAIAYDEQGQPTNIETLLAELAAARPHLVRQEPRPSAGAPVNPGRGAAAEPPLTHQQRLERVYGGRTAAFDPASARAQGGGVFYVADPKTNNE